MANHDSDRPPYILKRDFRSSIRLNHNHWMIKSLCGYLIHPAIHTPSSNARIADVGTGTGIWLFEAAAETRAIEADGFDISSKQFPPKPWWPANINLVEHDAFKPFPARYLGKYDVVNVRFVLLLVNDEDAEPLLKNVVSLLKPGGYLQWFEPNAPEVEMKSYNPEAPTAAVEKLAIAYHKPTPKSTYNWLAQMPELFERQALTLEAREEHPTPDYLRFPWAQGNLAGLDDMVDSSVPMAEGKVQDMRALMAGLSEEFERGVAIETGWLCFVGKKRF